MRTRETISRLAVAAVLVIGAGFGPPVAAQYAVDPGEAIAAIPLKVMSAPVEGSAQVMEIEAGRTVTVLGYPRGTGMAWIAIGGRELGYVSAGALAPIDRQRPVLFRSAVIVKPVAGDGSVLPGDQILKTGKGRVVDVTGVQNGRALLQGGDTKGVAAGDLVPIIGTYPAGTLGPGAPGFFAARLGRYATPAEASASWDRIASALPELRELTPYVFRRITPEGPGIELAAGPFDRARVEEVCTMLARRSHDCWVIAVDFH